MLRGASTRPGSTERGTATSLVSDSSITGITRAATVGMSKSAASVRATRAGEPYEQSARKSQAKKASTLVSSA